MRKRAALLVLSALLLMSGCEKIKDAKEKNTAPAEDTVSQSAEMIQTENETSAAETEVSEEKQEQSSSDTETAEETQNQSPEVSEEDYENVLDSIAFIGDSVTSGFSAYQKVDMDKVFATPCVGPSNIRDYSFEYGGDEYAALTILNFEQPDYVVISMGLNDINTYSPENFSEIYMDFVEDAMAVCEDSQFYIFSVTPVAAECENITNDTIDGVNAQLEKTVSEYGSDRLHYVDCNTVLKNENGCLAGDFSGGDGIHLSSGAYDVMLEKLVCSISGE